MFEAHIWLSVLGLEKVTHPPWLHFCKYASEGFRSQSGCRTCLDEESPAEREFPAISGGDRTGRPTSRYPTTDTLRSTSTFRCGFPLTSTFRGFEKLSCIYIVKSSSLRYLCFQWKASLNSPSAPGRFVQSPQKMSGPCAKESQDRVLHPLRASNGRKLDRRPTHRSQSANP